ncbi:MAG: YdiU family protein [Burkholderiales bacterium]|nr:YdiU family protein [Burkholderiales bacterium]
MSAILDAYSASAAAPPAAQEPAGLHWSHRFAGLGQDFFTAMAPAPLADPAWVALSDSCAAELGLPSDWWQCEPYRSLEVFSGNALWPGMRPLASVYSGHQFGVWAGQLGDGRALLLGEIDTPHGPRELQLKGAGRTPYSRMGDGRAVLRSTIREFLCSEAMHALGIPTTRSLCMTASPQPVRREEIETAAVVTRVAPSFLRFGHYEHFAHHGLHPQLRQLVDFTIAHFYPACADAPRPAAALLAEVTRRTAALMADWQAVGFCHGVMNTDNLSILGLTIDYGPFGFLDAFDPDHICNHSDQQGRYAFRRQPGIGLWNLHALAQALLPLVDDDDDVDAMREALAGYESAFSEAMLARLRAKLGLVSAREDDAALVDDLLGLMAQDRCDYTLTWRAMSRLDTAHDHFIDRAAFDAWALRYRARLAAEASDDAERAARMNRVNPKYVLRNHLAENAIRRSREGDHTEVQRLLKVLSRPFDEQPESASDAALPPDWARQLEVSCSS